MLPGCVLMPYSVFYETKASLASHISETWRYLLPPPTNAINTFGWKTMSGSRCVFEWYTDNWISLLTGSWLVIESLLSPSARWQCSHKTTSKVRDCAASFCLVEYMEANVESNQLERNTHFDITTLNGEFIRREIISYSTCRLDLALLHVTGHVKDKVSHFNEVRI